MTQLRVVSQRREASAPQGTDNDSFFDALSGHSIHAMIVIRQQEWP